MSANFEKSFEDFFLKLTVLNYKLLAKAKIEGEWEIYKNSIEVLIPIFNRITTDKTLSLKDVVESKETKQFDIPVITVEEYPFAPTTTAIVAVSPAIQSDNKLETKSNDESPEDEPDIEGDQQVEELNNLSLKNLEEYKKYNLLLVEEEESEEISSEHTDDENGEDGEDDIDDVDKEVDENCKYHGINEVIENTNYNEYVNDEYIGYKLVDVGTDKYDYECPDYFY